MLSNTEALLHLIDTYQLGDAVRFVLENNPSQTLPYHSTHHALTVMLVVNEAWQYDQKLFYSKRSEDMGDTPKELLLAALFHDYNYQVFERGQDHHNIQAALQGWKAYWTQSPGGTEMSYSTVHTLIRSTEVPHTYHRDYDGYMQMVCCLQDADFSCHSTDTIFGPLIGIKGEYFDKMDWPKYLEESMDWYGSVLYKTSWGRNIAHLLRMKTLNNWKRLQQLVFPEAITNKETQQ